jgi:hypothetical protein
MADDEKNENGQPEVPPKLVIKPQGSPTDEEEMPGTIKMKPIVLSTPGEETLVADAAPQSKKETSRISLDAALPSGSGSSSGDTIKVKPAVSPLSVSPQKPTVVSSEGPAPSIEDDLSAEKRKTSRISLEAALASEPTVPGSEGPKTIRLKRPSEAATVKVGQSSPPKSETTPIEAEAPSLNKTADIAAQMDVPEPTTATRKKTIRVKRPSRSPGVKTTPEIRRTEEAGAPGVPGVEEAVPVQDRPNWFFVFSSVAAILVAGVLIYVLTAQAFGPNASLTRLSYGAPELNLAWPGKIQPTR